MGSGFVTVILAIDLNLVILNQLMICFYHNFKKKCIFIQSYFLPGKLPLELIN